MPESSARRIAVVTDAVAPWNTGGKEQRQHALLTRLAVRGYRIDVYTMRWWGDEPSIERDGVVFHGICRKLPLYSGDRRSIRQALVFALSTLRVIAARFDVLEVDAIPFLPLFPARLVAWARRRPMIVTWHEYWGPAYWQHYLGPLGRIAAAVERLAIALPDRIVAASEGTAQRLRDAGPRGADVRVVTNGIRLDRRPPAPKPVLDGRPVRLVNAGRLLDHKRVDAAIGAVAELANRGIDSMLTVIGEGPAAQGLRSHAASLGVAERIEFVDFLPSHDDVLDRFEAADLLVFPSEREGFGMVALEAMSCGTPVITSDHPDNTARSLVDPGIEGELCPSRPEAIAEAIQRALPHLAQLSAGALCRAQSFGWDRIADSAEDAYRSRASAVEVAPQGVEGGLGVPRDADQAEVVGKFTAG